MKTAYLEKNLATKTLDTIEQANIIIEEYEADGLKLTLRQLYYQFVSRALIENTEREYKRLGNTISDGRLIGLIDWLAIEDRTRRLVTNSHWLSPADIVDSCVACYAIDKWAAQAVRPEVWIEKEALLGVIEPVCAKLDVACFACKGYISQSAMWRAGRRFCENADAGQESVVIYLGDLDPSGVDMTRDIKDRLSLFAQGSTSHLEVVRIALTEEQVQEHSPPPNPAKVSDSRFRSFALKYGNESWELDALEPSLLQSLVTDEVLSHRNDRLWSCAVKQEDAGRQALKKVAQSLDNERS